MTILERPAETAAAEPVRVKRLAATADRHRWLVPVLVGIVAFAVRVPAMRQGLPYIWHPDEPSNLVVGSNMALLGGLPSTYAYPSLLFDLVAGVVWFRVHVLGTDPMGPVMSISSGTGWVTQPQLVWILRTFSALASATICALVCFAIQRTTRRTGVAIFVAALLVLSPLLVTNGVLVTPDIYAGAFTTAALVGALWVLRRGTWPAYVCTGAFAGLAAASKYNAGLVVVAPVVAHLIRHRRVVLRRLEPLWRLLAMVGTTAVVFVATTPGVVVEPSEVWNGIQQERHHYATGHAGMTGSSVSAYLEQLLHGDLVLMIGAFAAVIALLGRHRWEAVVVASFALCYSLLVGTQAVHFPRTLVPLLPALALLTGFAIATAIDLLDASGGERRSKWVLPALGALAVLLLIPQAVGATRVPAQLAERGRGQAKTWLLDRLPPGSTVMVEGFGPFLGDVPRSRQLHVDAVGLIAMGVKVPATTDAIVVSEIGTGRFMADPSAFPAAAAGYRKALRGFCPAAEFADGGPWIRIYTRC